MMTGVRRGEVERREAENGRQANDERQRPARGEYPAAVLLCEKSGQISKVHRLSRWTASTQCCRAHGRGEKDLRYAGGLTPVGKT